MKNLLPNSVFTLLCFVSLNSFGQSLTDAQKAVVATFIEHVDNNDWINLSETISYPIDRTYPVPDIETKADFLKRINDLFDDSLISIITNSQIDSNWFYSGSRGIKLNNGDIWINNEGNITEINYQTASEKIFETKLIESDRESLPVYLSEYVRPVLKMNTDKWIIRVDQVKGQSYRFVGWIQGNRNPNRDAVEIIPNGFLEYQGEGGNHSYTFTSDIGTFVCFVNETPEVNGPIGELVIYRNGELIRSYPANSMDK